MPAHSESLRLLLEYMLFSERTLLFRLVHLQETLSFPTRSSFNFYFQSSRVVIVKTERDIRVCLLVKERRVGVLIDSFFPSNRVLISTFQVVRSELQKAVRFLNRALLLASTGFGLFSSNSTFQVRDHDFHCTKFATCLLL